MSDSVVSKLRVIGGKTLPVIRQSEVTECGNACLAMVAGYYGFKTDIASLRRRFPSSAQGTTLRLLAENATRLGFSTRALKLDLPQIGHLQLPAIIHWDLNHFVVLEEAGNKHVTIHDPAAGRVKMDYEEFGKHFTGIALELSVTSEFETRDEKVKLKISSLWTHIRGLRSSLVQILVLSLIMQAYALAAPQYLQTVIDDVLPRMDVSLLLILAIGFALFAVINVVASVIRGFVVIYAGSSMGFQVVENLFTHLSRLPLSFFERRHIGDIVSRFSSTGPIQNFMVEGVVGGIVDGLLVILTLVLMFVYSPLLALISLAAFGINLILRLGLFRAFRRASEAEIVSEAVEQTNFMESVRGMLTIKAFSEEEHRKQRWQNLLADSVNQSIKVKKLELVFSSGSMLIKTIESVIVIYIAASMVMAGDFSIGMIFAYTAYRTQFVDKSHALVELVIQFKMLDLHLERISDIAIAEPERESDDRFDISNGELIAQDLSFSYGQGLPQVFSDVSFHIKAGECVALVGPSGCGKTTLLKILMGLIEPDTGEVFVDGHSLGKTDLKHYRMQVGSVMQSDSLFEGSLAENICFFDINPDINLIKYSAQKACIHDEITRMPMGYETPVGDMGSAISGGQLQRVLLARALYRQPKMLFIDEGTSHLDVGTEEVVNNSIKKLGITRIIVAHRPQTIAMADRVFTYDMGQFTEE